MVSGPRKTWSNPCTGLSQCRRETLPKIHRPILAEIYVVSELEITFGRFLEDISFGKCLGKSNNCGLANL